MTEQKIEKIKEIKTHLMIELEKAQILIQICKDEELTESLQKKDLSIISGIALDNIIRGAKMVEDLELLLLKNF